MCIRDSNRFISVRIICRPNCNIPLKLCDFVSGYCMWLLHGIVICALWPFAHLMAEGRKEKYQRLERFRRRLPHVSASALSSILHEVSESGVPELHNRWNMSEARDQRMQEDTPYGQMLTEISCLQKNGGDKKLLMVNPFAVLFVACSQGGFRRSKRIIDSRGSPLVK